MKHTRVSLRVHCIWSTKDRAPTISEDTQPRLWAFIGGIARRLGMTAVAVGGWRDHVHALLLIPPTIAVATAVQKLKANSSRWMTQQIQKAFAWQEGYGAFSVSISHTDATVRYIRRQGEHHKRHTFDEEFARILIAHGFNPTTDTGE